MAIQYPTALDNLNNPSASTLEDASGYEHDVQHSDANDAIEALEAKVGVDGSAVTTSLDYKATNHAHTGSGSTQVSHANLTGVTANQHHNQSHDHSSSGDGTSLSPATLVIPSALSSSQTAEGSVVWDSDDDVLTVGDGSSRKIFGYEGSTTPSALGTASAGSGNEMARANHVHAKATESELNLSDVATFNSSTSLHGFLKKLDNTASNFMDGTGNWDSVKDSDLSTSDITTNDVTTSKHGFAPKAPNDTTKFLRGDASWAVPTGGTIIKTIWSPDAPPSSAGSIDDEFTSGSSGSWTEFDPNSVLTPTYSTTYNMLLLTQSTRTGDNVTGIYQTLPAGDFTIWTKIMPQAPYTNYTVGGLCLWEDPTDTSKKLYSLGITVQGSGVTKIEQINWTNHNVSGGSPISISLNQFATGLYIRLSRNGSNYYCTWSYDGISWQGDTTARNPTFTPTKVGLMCNNVNIGANTQVVFPFFRYVASDIGTQGISQGRLVTLYGG